MSRSKPLSREAKLRANGLLDMLYTPSELAEELGIAPWEVYRKIAQGLPCNRDKDDKVWIHGPEVARWLRTFESKWRATERQHLDANEAYCLRCRQATQMVNPKRSEQGKFITLAATCANCGGQVHRGIKAL